MMEEQLTQLTENIKDNFQKIGLYLDDIQIGTTDATKLVNEDDPTYEPDVHKLIKDGEAQFVYIATFDIGDVAWRDRILDPEQHEMEQEFNAIVPREEDVVADSLEEMLKKFGKDV